MAKVTQIGQGGSLAFSFDLGGESLEGRVCNIYVKQHLKDIATITREIPLNVNETAFDGLLTSAETKILEVGLWHIFARLDNPTTGESRQIRSSPIRFEVLETVVDPGVVTTILSVSSGTAIPAGGNFARFNFTQGPSLLVGQRAVISGYVTNTLYNDTGLVIATGPGFIEITSEITFLAIKLGTDESGGSFTI